VRDLRAAFRGFLDRDHHHLVRRREGSVVDALALAVVRGGAGEEDLSDAHAL
jgi:hypothetical protein